jgi:hypothetical protein
MSVVKKSISAWLDWAKKIKNKVQKVVKKLSKSCQTLSNLEKINKRENKLFRKSVMILENWV